MNRKEAAQVLAILKASYPNFYKSLTAEDAQGIVSVWSMQFAGMSAEIVLMALNKAISSCTYPPSIAEVKEKLRSVHWDAYEMLDANYRNKNLSPEEVKMYKRIYEETQGYKFTSNAEPKIQDMLPGKSDVKQLSERTRKDEKKKDDVQFKNFDGFSDSCRLWYEDMGGLPKQSGNGKNK